MTSLVIENNKNFSYPGADDFGRLLVVAFHYPPDNTSTGVLRTLKFTQYLLNHHWVSEVLSVPECLYFSKDPGSVSQIPSEIKVHRTWGMDIAKKLSIRGIYPDFVTIPDRFWPWIFSAPGYAADLIKSKRFDAIYTTYPVSTAHLIGCKLKQRFGLPWIADFRDPWVEYSMTPFRQYVEGIMERKVMTLADRIICNTPAMRRFFLQRYPDLPADKFVTITNGYDEEDFGAIVPSPVPKFEIMYPGMLSQGNRNPRPLFAGIRLALDRKWLPEDGIQITFLGGGPYAKSAMFNQDVDQFNLRDKIHIVEERIPYREALRRVAGAEVVVVLSEPLGEGPKIEAERQWSHLQVPAKVYEILRLGRPMLALVSSGAVAELLERTQSGKPVTPTDTENVALSLKHYYDDFKQNGCEYIPTPGPKNALVTEYSRENLTKLLAAELNDLVPQATAKRA